MNVTPTEIAGVYFIEPRLYGDDRGTFTESWAAARYEAHGVPGPFVQDNLSRSCKGTLRGLHLQHPCGQGKLVQAVQGDVLDVAVDVRRGSPTFGHHVARVLRGARFEQLWIPAGFAHGFCVLTDEAIVAYKCTNPYQPAAEVGVAWNDPDLGIAWPVAEPVLSARDRAHPRLAQIEPARLPVYEDAGLAR